MSNDVQCWLNKYGNALSPTNLLHYLKTAYKNKYEYELNDRQAQSLINEWIGTVGYKFTVTVPDEIVRKIAIIPLR